MAISSFLWYLDGRATTTPAPINLKSNESKVLVVILQTDGTERLDENSVKWDQELVRPPQETLGPAPRLILKPKKGSMNEPGSAQLYEAVVVAPGSTGKYSGLEFIVSAQALSDPAHILKVTIAVHHK